MQIFVTGDVGRPNPPQYQNVEWLYLLVRAQIQALTGIEPKFLYPKFSLTEEEWVESQSQKVPSTHWVAEHLQEFSIVIGFEMSRQMVEYLMARQVCFVNFIVYPIRFMDDLVMGVQVNKLSWPAQTQDLNFHLGANLMRAKYRRMPILQIPFGAALIVGQTKMDRSVIGRCGTIKSLSDFEDKIVEAKANHPQLLFKPHPDAANDQKTIALMNKHKIPIIHDNIYQILSQHNLAHVYGISSSVLNEAQYFQKPSTFWGERWAKDFLPVRAHTMLTIQFWRTILEGRHNISLRNTQEIELTELQSRVRESCQAFWGFPKQ